MSEVYNGYSSNRQLTDITFRPLRFTLRGNSSTRTRFTRGIRIAYTMFLSAAMVFLLVVPQGSLRTDPRKNIARKADVGGKPELRCLFQSLADKLVRH